MVLSSREGFSFYTITEFLECKYPLWLKIGLIVCNCKQGMQKSMLCYVLGIERLLVLMPD